MKFAVSVLLFLVVVRVSTSEEHQKSEVKRDGVKGEGYFFTGRGSFLQAHNRWRRWEGHKLKSVTWDKELAMQAAQTVIKCRLRHGVHGKKTTRYSTVGQNVYFIPKKVSAIEAANTAVRAWMSEKKFYHYKNNYCYRHCKHYTQVVWSGTRAIGCAVSASCSSGTYVVCNYGPAGNWSGYRPY